MNKDWRRFRDIDMANDQLGKDEIIDVIVTFNNVNTRMPSMIQDVYVISPPESPYVGMRGKLGDITRVLESYATDFTTVSLAPVLGMKPFGIVPGDIKATSILKPPQRFTGKGTLIGLMGTGIDYTNPAFIDANGHTRIEAIWDQTAEGESLYNYGAVYTREMINQALQSPDPFAIVPHKDDDGEGTMLGAIAAGFASYEEGQYRGVAPEAELIVVKLRPASPALQKVFHGTYNPLGFSGLDVALAVQYMCNTAAKLQKPISLCFTVGGNTGPHDGSEALANVLGAYGVNRGIAMVVAAGDEANQGNHASGNLKENPFQQVKLIIPKGQEGFVVEIWADFGDEIEASLVPPQAEQGFDLPVAIILLNQPQVYPINDSSYVWIGGNKIDPESGCQVIRFRLNNPDEGEWTISIRGVNILTGTYHIWIPKSGMLMPRTVLTPYNPFVTIYNSAVSEGVITVGCYDKAATAPCSTSGRGPTRDGRTKPDFIVDGVNVPAPLPDNTFGHITGTAGSAAITAGVCALIYQRQKDHNTIYFNTPMMKTMLVQQLIRDLTMTYPNPSTGYGLLDVNTFSYQ